LDQHPLDKHALRQHALGQIDHDARRLFGIDVARNRSIGRHCLIPGDTEADGRSHVAIDIASSTVLPATKQMRRRADSLVRR
jgi:hypothetical protein